MYSYARAATLAVICGAFASAAALAAPQVVVRGLVDTETSRPPNWTQCEKQFGVPCYSPHDMQTAYGLKRLIAAGMVGTGQTIIVVDSYGSPTIARDLAAFDAGYRIPNPPSFQVLAPLGTVPWDPKLYPDEPGWAAETTLDVEWAHAMAPGAAIVLLTSPVDETEGVQGLPEFLKLEEYALAHHLGGIISQSWAATENTLFENAAGPQGPKLIADYQAFYARAASEQVTVLGAAGDDGTSNFQTNGVDFYQFPTVNFPASSPLVTAVGGTDLTLVQSGKYQSEKVWSDKKCCAGGGGLSQIFKEPQYQKSAVPQSVLDGARGLPDVSYNAAVGDEFILVYAGFPGTKPGWYGIGGTSEGSPQWAGIVADLDQYEGRPLGFLNPMLYSVGSIGLFGHIGRDIAKGDNALIGVKGATAPGYRAAAGWDPASGWGTPNLAAFPGVDGSSVETFATRVGIATK